MSLASKPFVLAVWFSDPSKALVSFRSLQPPQRQLPYTKPTSRYIRPMSSKSPKTPPASRRLGYDPDKTPTPRRTRRERRSPIVTPSPKKQNSFEDDPVMSLPDPRELSSLAYLDIWQGPILDSLRDAFPNFLSVLNVELKVSRPTAYRRMCMALSKRNEHGQADLGLIMREASLLFVGCPDLANSLNHCLPPGFSLEAAEDYVVVFIPGHAWKQFANGRREVLYTD